MSALGAGGKPRRNIGARAEKSTPLSPCDSAAVAGAARCPLFRRGRRLPGVDEGAQYVVDAGLIAFARGAEPRQHVAVDAELHRLLARRQPEADSGFPAFWEPPLLLVGETLDVLLGHGVDLGPVGLAFHLAQSLSRVTHGTPFFRHLSPSALK